VTVDASSVRSNSARRTAAPSRSMTAASSHGRREKRAIIDDSLQGEAD
jgi:hypothetical protein